jgi:hypothetical protein
MPRELKLKEVEALLKRPGRHLISPRLYLQVRRSFRFASIALNRPAVLAISASPPRLALSGRTRRAAADQRWRGHRGRSL